MGATLPIQYYLAIHRFTSTRRRLAAALQTVLALVAFIAAGCEDDDCTAPTSDLSMVAIFVDNGDTIRATVDFAYDRQSEFLSPWRRCSSDELLISGRVPIEIERGDRIEYSVDIDSAAEAMISIRRHDTALDIVVPFPEPMDIVTPTAGAAVSRSETLVVEWSNPADQGMLHLQLFEQIGGGQCLSTPLDGHMYKDRGYTVPDVGTWTIPIGTIQSVSEDPCEAALRLIRFLTASYPDELAPGGFIETRVERQVPFTSIP